MSLLALYLFKMSLCSGVLYAYYYLALRNRVFHQYNRFYLLAAVLFSMLFPLIPLPNFYEAAQPAGAIQLYRLLLFSSGESEVVVQATRGWNWQTMVGVLYVAVCLLLLGRLASGLMQIRSLMMAAEVQHSEKLKFIKTDHAAAPFSFFNWLFWKQDIDLESEGGQAVLRHELVHIREKHSVDKLLVQAVLIFFWINPVFWLMRRELQMIHEFIADKKAVGQEGAAALAAMILRSAYSTQYNNLTAAFFQQPIKRRLAMLQRNLTHPQNAYLGRVLALPLCVLLFFACAKKEEQPLKSPSATSANTVLNDSIVTQDIAEVSVNKQDSVSTITITYKNGKKETLTEKQAMEKGLIKPPPPPPPAPMPSEALLVIDGKEDGLMKDSKKFNELLENPNDIESMNVLKGEIATKKYGAKGTNGVTEIITKKEGQNKNAAPGANSMVPRQGPDIVHIEVEQAPKFPGGEMAWRSFLASNLKPSTPVDNGAPPGTYPVQVQFKVANDGTIFDIQPTTYIGYGMEKEVVALMQKSPKWIPAEQNGYKVTSLHKQKVTFVVAEE
jgi:hypothetical protein